VNISPVVILTGDAEMTQDDDQGLWKQPVFLLHKSSDGTANFGEEVIVPTAKAGIA
jgi:hypothetical protein